MLEFTGKTAGIAVTSSSRALLIATFGCLLLQPLLGTRSDRGWRRTNLLFFSGGMTLFAVPLFGALARVQTMLAAVLLVFAALAILSFYTSVSGLFKAELFPARVRALGVGLRSEEHTSELQSLMRISYAVFCLKKKTTHTPQQAANTP